MFGKPTARASTSSTFLPEAGLVSQDLSLGDRIHTGKAVGQGCSSEGKDEVVNPVSTSRREEGQRRAPGYWFGVSWPNTDFCYWMNDQEPSKRTWGRGEGHTYGPKEENHRCQFLLKLGLTPGRMPHILTVEVQAHCSMSCDWQAPSTFAPEGGTRQGVVATGGMASQRLREGLGVLQHCVRWHSSNRGSVALTWKSKARWHSEFCPPAATQSPGPK